jgi:hypothetical protein
MGTIRILRCLWGSYCRYHYPADADQYCPEYRVRLDLTNRRGSTTGMADRIFAPPGSGTPHTHRALPAAAKRLMASQSVMMAAAAGVDQARVYGYFRIEVGRVHRSSQEKSVF